MKIRNTELSIVPFSEFYFTVIFSFVKLDGRGEGADNYFCEAAGMVIISYLFLTAEYADSSQRTQTGWECGDDANDVGYATIPARFI